MTDAIQATTATQSPVAAYEAYCAASKQLCEMRVQVENMQVEALKAMRGSVVSIVWGTETEYDDCGGNYTVPIDVELRMDGDKDVVYLRHLSSMMDDDYIEVIGDMRGYGIEVPDDEALSEMDEETLENIYIEAICKYAEIDPEHGRMFYTMVFDFIEDNMNLYGLLLE